MCIDIIEDSTKTNIDNIHALNPFHVFTSSDLIKCYPSGLFGCLICIVSVCQISLDYLLDIKLKEMIFLFFLKE